MRLQGRCTGVWRGVQRLTRRLSLFFFYSRQLGQIHADLGQNGPIQADSSGNRNR